MFTINKLKELSSIVGFTISEKDILSFTGDKDKCEYVGQFLTSLIASIEKKKVRADRMIKAQAFIAERRKERELRKQKIISRVVNDKKSKNAAAREFKVTRQYVSSLILEHEVMSKIKKIKAT